MCEHVEQMAATIEGWIHWELIEDGQVVQEGEQHNLWLNQGLDRMAVTALTSIADYLIVGTGTTEPAVTQTSFGATELARTASNPQAIAVGPTYPTPEKARFTFQREFSETVGNGNLTEWGAAAASSGAVVARELFRDGNGNAIIVTKTNTQKLRITYTLDFTMGPTVATAASLTIAGLGTYTGTYMLHDPGTTSGNGWKALQSVMAGLFEGRVGAMAQAQAQTYSSFWTAIYSAVTPITNEAYVSGSFKRRATVSVPTTQGNQAWYGIVLYVNPSGSNNSHSGYSFKFGAGQTFTKDNLHRLDLTLFEVTWGRA